MAEVIRKRKGQRGGTDVNQNKAKPKLNMSMKDLAKEKIRKQMKGPPDTAVKDLPKSKKSKKAKVSKAPTKAAPLTKGKSYKSSQDRNVTEQDVNSKDVLIKKYVKDTKAGGRSKRGEFWSLVGKYFVIFCFLLSLAGTKELQPGI